MAQNILIKMNDSKNTQGASTFAAKSASSRNTITLFGNLVASLFLGDVPDI